MPLLKIRQFLKLEAASGMILLFAAIMALLIDNSPFSYLYEQGLARAITIPFFDASISGTVLFWINEGLMTLFFLLVGLELKREFVEGELSSGKQVLLPGVAALGGMAVPAMVYMIFNYHHPMALKGWAIPVATDIAFALGVLSLFGKRVPLGLKVFLLALAIFDDVGAILIITFFYSHDLHGWFLLLGGILLLCLRCMTVFGVKKVLPYLIVGLVLWVTIYRAGMHASIVGVVLALLMPTNRDFESRLHPWVAYLIMPIFAFANAGVSFVGMHWNVLFDTLTLGIMAGLVLGKQLGVFSMVWAMVKLGFATLPKGTTWLQFYGIACLCGIGFTMSLFLGTLAFQYDQPIYLVEVRLGVLLGSLISGLIGAMILFVAFKKMHNL